MASKRATSISRKTLIAPQSQRNGSRLKTGDSSHRTYRSKTPQPPARSKTSCEENRNNNNNKKKKMLQYRARKDSGSQRDIEEELPDYIKATTPQPHILNSNISDAISLQRSQSDRNVYTNCSNSAQNESMFTFVKSQFEPDMAFNDRLSTIPIIDCNNTTPIPMIHNQLPPHCDHDFNTRKIHEIPKPPPPPPPPPRTRADSAQSTASMTPEFGALLSPKQMEEQILSHYDKTKRKSKMGFLTKIKETKQAKTKRKSKKRNSRNRSNSKPFNDEDYTEINIEKKEKENEQLFVNKLHPSYTHNPLHPPKSTPPQGSNHWKNIAQITPHSYMDDRKRSYSGNSNATRVTPYPLDNEGHLLHEHVNRPQSAKTGQSYDGNEFMDDAEVAAKSFAFDRSLRRQTSRDRMEYEREMDKMRFKCDQLDWNLNTLQTNTDKDMRQITAKMHRVEHDIKTQNELVDRFETKRRINNRRNSIFNSLESSIGAVMRNVESIKDALQTLDLRMSIINQRQHDIFKHIDETKHILSKNKKEHISDESNSNSNSGGVPLALNPLDKSNALLSSRRASLQSMSEMLRLQSRDDAKHNPLLLPTYDDDEDILNPKSATKKKLLGHIRPELLIQHNEIKTTINDTQSIISQRFKKNKSHDISANDDYGIVIERTVSSIKPQSDLSKLASIIEKENDTDSTESETACAPMNNEKPKKAISLSRRTHHQHIRSSIDSGLSDNIISQIKCETMLIHSSVDSDSESESDSDEDEECVMNKGKTHSRDMNISMDNVDIKTLEIPITNKLNPNSKMKRKYSESFSITVNESHCKNTMTRMDIGNDERTRTGSMSYDIGKEANITYEREISQRNDMDPLGLCGYGLKDRTQNNNEMLSPVDDENDSVSSLSADSMSDLSANDHDIDDFATFEIHNDTLMKALEIQERAEEESISRKKKSKKKEKQRILLMNISFKLQIVPNTFNLINDFITNRWSDKPSYIVQISNNTTSHDLFFKTSKIYSAKQHKSLIFFRECDEDTCKEDDDDVIVIDDNAESDDHLAPMEHMTFGDLNIKRGLHYCGYFVFEAYPFPNLANANDDCDGDISRRASISSVITPNYKTNPITPHLKPHTILNAIDEKHKYETGDLQFTELKLGAMSPSTVNKYRRQSLSTSSRRTSLQYGYGKEASVTSLLGRALDEEQNDNGNNYPWNDDLDDLIDIVIGFDIQLSIGDPQLNSFKCYLQFSEYAQPTHYHTQLKHVKLLKSFCNGGSHGLHLSNDQLMAKVTINHKDTIHPQIVADISYALPVLNDQLSNTETFDID